MSKLIKYIVSAAAALALSACSDEMPRGTEVNEQGFHVYKLDMDIAFDDEEGSRAAHQWKSSEYVYIAFETSEKTIWGYAYYSSYDEKWNLYTISQLPDNATTGECSCWFFSNNYQHAISSRDTRINSSQDQMPYYAGTTFSRLGDVVSISAVLEPDMGRVRFRSMTTTSSYYEIAGIVVPKYLDLTNNNLELGEFVNTFRVNEYDSESGYYYSSYITAYFPNDDNIDRVLRLKDNNNNIYVRSYASNPEVLGVGCSGYIDIPLPESHDGWVMDKYKSYTTSYRTYGNSNQLSPEDNTYYFNTVATLESETGICAKISHKAQSIYNGTEATKKSAMLYIEVFDGAPEESSKPLTQLSIYLYRPEWALDPDKYYDTKLDLTLPSSIATTNTPQYRVSVLTDGVAMYLSEVEISNFF